MDKFVYEVEEDSPLTQGVPFALHHGLGTRDVLIGYRDKSGKRAGGRLTESIAQDDNTIVIVANGLVGDRITLIG